MRLRLPTVSLFAVDGADAGTALLRRSLEDTLDAIDPMQTVVFTHDPTVWRGWDTVQIPHCPSSAHAMWEMWYTVPNHVHRGTHVLHVEWDGWVTGADAWTDEFLGYDYIGAPWPLEWCGYDPDRAVGNGLGLRSLRLMRLLCDNPLSLPFHHPEDDGICRLLRPALEAEGVRFAPLGLAHRFSWEYGPRPRERTFLHHGCWNWPRLLSSEALVERMALADDYVRGTRGWRKLLKDPIRERVERRARG